MTLSSRAVQAALLKKGFRVSQGDHRWYILYVEGCKPEDRIQKTEFRRQNARTRFNGVGSPILREGPPDQHECLLGTHYPKMSCQENAEPDHRGAKAAGNQFTA
jgi:hypothetical protein